MNKREFTPEEITKSLRVCIDNAENGCLGCVTRHLGGNKACDALSEAAADLIEAQAKQIGELEAELAKLREENRWIPVEERMPELTEDEKRRILVDDYAAPEYIVMIEGAKKSTALYFDGEYWYDLGGTVYDVTRWKPMPKGPEVGHD